MAFRRLESLRHLSRKTLERNPQAGRKLRLIAFAVLFMISAAVFCQRPGMPECSPQPSLWVPPVSPVSSEAAGVAWSIIVPVFNEEKRVGPTLAVIEAHMRKRGASCEILVVDDGSTDGTAALVNREFPEVRLLRNPGNQGKGYSVRAGMRAAAGRLVLFTDADLSTPIEEMDRFEKELEGGADVVIASRALPDSVLEVRQVWWREMSGRIFNKIVRLLSGLPYADTQCGFKAYTRQAARRIAGLQRLDGWAFDVEQLHLARLLGLKVREVPVRWLNSPDTRVRFLRDASRMFKDILRIRWTRYPVER